MMMTLFKVIIIKIIKLAISKSAMLLTSNRDVEEWPQVFSDPVLANAAIDRMFEAANICIFQGESYRMKGRILMKDFDKEN